MRKEDTASENTPNRMVYDFDKAEINAVRFLWEILTRQGSDSRKELKYWVKQMNIVDEKITNHDKELENAANVLSGFLNFRQLNKWRCCVTHA